LTSLSALDLAQNVNLPSKSLMSSSGRKQHSRTRRDHASETAEDYVESIDALMRAHGECRLTELANRFGVSHVTAKKIVDRLSREGLVETIPYGPIGLTSRGKTLARKSNFRHRLVVDFLMAIGVSSDTAELDAEGIEHHVSPETLEKMKTYLDHSHGQNPRV
jgi:DtxR family transcriptional regulator, manganese transport regulator